MISSSIIGSARSKAGAFEAAKLTLPVFFAFFPLGIALGLLVHEYHLPVYMGFLMSFFIYAGSSEFVVASMLAASESLAEIAIAGLVINFRHIFYGLSVFDVIPKKGFKRFYSIATLSDETYALFLALRGEDRRYATLIAFLNHAYWFLSVTLGLILAKSFSLSFPGVEFCLPALFIVLTIEQYKSLKKISPFIFALASSLVAFLFFKEQFLVVSIALSSLLMLSIKPKGKK